MKKLITVILLVVCLSILFAVPASAAEYTDPLAVKFDDAVGYCDTFYDTLEWYAICKVSWTFVDWDYEGEPPKVQVPAAEYEAEIAKYCVLSESLLSAIRNETDYNGDPIYDAETNTYTAFYVGGWGGFLHNRVYAGYVQTGDDTYDVYYETVTFEFLEDLLPEGTTVEDIAGDDWPYTVEYEGLTYTNSPDGFYRIKSYDKSGIKYGVKLDGDNVLLATRTPYAVGEQPDVFDDVTIEDILTYEIVDGEAIITDCDDTVTGSITIPDTLDGYPVTTIGDFAFAHLTNPLSVDTGNSVVIISNSAFLGNTGLESVTLGDSVQSIGTLAFEACENLQSFSVSANNPNYSSNNGVLFNKNVTALIFAPKTIAGNYTVPAGVLTVGEYAFDGCMNLTGLVIGDDVTTIGSRAFNNCMNLKTVDLGSGVETISGYAFMNCNRMSQIAIPVSTTQIGDYAFGRCTALTDVFYSATQGQWDAINIGSNNDPLNAANLHCTIDPDYLTYTIVDGKAIVTDCSTDVSDIITIPSTLGGYPVTAIADYALSDCQYVYEIYIPEGVTTIGNYAFSWSWRLDMISLPASLTSIGLDVASNCSFVNHIYYPGTPEQWAQIAIDENNEYFNAATVHYTGVPYWYLSYEVTDGEVTITDCDEYYTGELVIPDTLDGYPVTAIGDNAFYDCNRITDVSISDNVASIGEYAFGFCHELANVKIGNNVTEIGAGAFFSCIKLAAFDIPDYITIIEADTFNGCDLLTEIEIPASVTSIGESAFMCTSLVSITIPDGVSSIETYTFHRCYDLTNVSLPSSIVTIDNYAFNECTALTDVYYAGSLKQWRVVDILNDNEYLTGSTLHFAINCDNGHTWDNNCDTECNVCDEIRSTTHSWDNGLVTKPTSCKESGERTYTCGSCGETYTEFIPQLTTHTWDHACDTECNVCGAVRTVSHSYDSGVVTTPATCMVPGVKTYTCGICFDTKTEPIEKLTTHTYDNPCDNLCNICGGFRVTQHTYKNFVTKATLTKDGSIVNKCSGCGVEAWTAVIYRPTSFTLSTVNYTYNGAAKKPAVTVKDSSGKTLVNGTDYTVTYPSGRTALGTYTVTITMMGNYSGTKTLTFKIGLATPTVTVSNAPTGVKITWNKIAGATSYKVYKSVYSGGKWSGWVAIKTGVTGTTYTDTSVKSADNVKYTVRAFNGNHSSTFKASNSIKYLA
ncbi:MAG: leucine-rich repeat protein, partial [Oscillospiraceae bacterium]|nr:leucine-rich repeat protein [Oscillospiraceae bacterium]